MPNYQLPYLTTGGRYLSSCIQYNILQLGDSAYMVIMLHKAGAAGRIEVPHISEYPQILVIVAYSLSLLQYWSSDRARLGERLYVFVMQ